MGTLRTSEVVSLAYFGVLAAAAWFSQVSRRRRVRTSVAAAALALSVVLIAGAARAPLRAQPLRDWWPLLLLVTSYWLPAGLVRAPAVPFERRLLAQDAALLRTAGGQALLRAPRAVRELLEAAYLGVYPMVPIALGLLLHAGQSDSIDPFWTVVLTAEYLCYGALPLLPTRAPRALEALPAYDGRAATMRRVNLWILSRASNSWNTFPSGHVAGAFACALATLPVLPAAGAALAILALVIAVASFAGRYHYAADAVAGVALAAGVFLLLS